MCVKLMTSVSVDYNTTHVYTLIIHASQLVGRHSPVPDGRPTTSDGSASRPPTAPPPHNVDAILFNWIFKLVRKHLIDVYRLPLKTKRLCYSQSNVYIL